MQSLWWKQWRESRGYLAIFTAWMVLAAGYCIGYQIGYGFRAPVGQFSSWALSYSICAAIILAMRAAQGERAAGTLSFSASLPVSLRAIAGVRIAGAAVTLALPILLGAALLALALFGGLIEQAVPRAAGALVRLPDRETASLPIALEQLGSVTAIAVLGGVELLLVLSWLGCRLRSQAQVGLLGAVLGFSSIIASGLLWFGERQPYLQLAYGAALPQSLVIHWGYGEANGGSYADHELARYRWGALALALPLLMFLARLFVGQYGLLPVPGPAPKSRRFRLATPPIWSRIPIYLPGRWGALIWLELRQSLPLVTFGLLLAILITVATAVIEPRAALSLTGSLRSQLPHTIAMVGMLWAAVVGSALYSAELGAGLGAFWRSRPIPPGRWFWCKFVVGLVAVLSVLDGVTVVACWTAPRQSMTLGMSWAYVGCFPILHALLYSLAVFGTCWLRRPVIGGFLAILGYAAVTILVSTFPTTVSLEPMMIYNALLAAERAGVVDFTRHGYPLVFGLLALSSLLFAWLASRLARPLVPARRWFASPAG